MIDSACTLEFLQVAADESRSTDKQEETLMLQTIPKTMKAVAIDKFGGEETMKYQARPVPEAIRKSSAER